MGPKMHRHSLGRDDTSPTSCVVCIANKLNLCGDILKKMQAGRHGDAPALTAPAITARAHTIPARRIISRPPEWSEFITFICVGWAVSSLALPNGRRQIVSFLLSGDVISVANLFEPHTDRLTESVTEVTYRNFNRSEFVTAWQRNSDALKTFAGTWVKYDLEKMQLILDLGRRTAEERIAHLILVLADRLAIRGFGSGAVIEFPLRQHHIADAMGLTPVHVNKVLSAFRRSGLIDIEGRSLAILDPIRLRRVATLQ